MARPRNLHTQIRSKNSFARAFAGLSRLRDLLLPPCDEQKASGSQHRIGFEQLEDRTLLYAPMGMEGLAEIGKVSDHDAEILHFDPISIQEQANEFDQHGEPIIEQPAGQKNTGGSDAAGQAAPVPLSALPSLHSNPGAAASIFLDFDGHFEAQWGGYSNVNTPVFDRDGDATTFSSYEIDVITELWKHVSEDFAPFEIDVTTVDPGDFSNWVSLRASIGGTGSWTGGYWGGYAYINSFTNSIANTVYIFPDNYGSYELDWNLGDVVSHEAGHGFGLWHQSTYDSYGNKTAEYNPGDSQRDPIMGGGWYKRSTWAFGTNNWGPFYYQDDMLGISCMVCNGFGYRADDHGDTPSSATALNVSGNQVNGAGIIERTSDVDYFSFTSGAGQISLTADVQAKIANLDVRLELYDSNGQLIASADPSDILAASIVTTVSQGDYQLAVLSHGEYGDVGQYTVSGTIVGSVPDLIVSNLEVISYTDSQISYGYTITNIGTGPANLDGPTDVNYDNVSVQAFLSADTIFNNQGDLPAGGTILGISPLGLLQPGESISGSFSSTVEIDPSRTYLTLMVDWGGVVDESNENNNTLAVLIETLNQAPVNSVPGTQTTNEDTALIFSTAGGNLISISDQDAGSNPVEVMLSSTNGMLTLAGTSGLIFSTGDGSADATMTFTGTISDIDAALDGLTLDPTPDFNGFGSILITTDDLGNTGFGGPLSDTDTIGIVVNAVNDAPDLAPIADQTMSPNQGSLTLTLSATDVDGDTLTYSVQIETFQLVAYQLDQQLGLRFVGSYYENAHGVGAKWMLNAANQWYFILPNGELYQWQGSIAASTLVATLDSSYHTDPSRLHDAPLPAPVPTASITGNQLTITPNGLGNFHMTVSVTDGTLSDQQSFQLSVTNAAPQLNPIADQTISPSQGSLTVTLSATDVDGDSLTYSVQIESLEQVAYDLDQQLGLYFVGSYYENYHGAGEKWMQSASGQWYGIMPNGELYRWGGSLAVSTLVATLDSSYHANPTLLHDAPQPGPAPATASVTGNQLTITPDSGFVGSFRVIVSVTDGFETTSQSFGVSVTNSAPELAQIGDQTISPSQGSLVLSLSGSDADGDALTYSVQIESFEQVAYDLDQQLGFYSVGNYYENSHGVGAKWMLNAANQWHFILPNGELYHWGGSIQASTLEATLDSSYHADPSLLHNAPLPGPAPATASITGNQLTITPNPGFVGSFRVIVSVTDGTKTASQSFEVSVTNTAPELAPIPDQTISHGQGSLTVALSASDADSDSLTYSVQIETVQHVAYQLDQQLGLRFAGSYYENAHGVGAKWMLNAANQWYFILPNGELYRWQGSIAASTLVATLDSSFHADPSSVHDALPPDPAPVTVSISGNQLTIDPSSGFVGELRITVSVSDGRGSDSQTFLVTVTDDQASAIDQIMSELTPEELVLLSFS